MCFFSNINNLDTIIWSKVAIFYSVLGIVLTKLYGIRNSYLIPVNFKQIYLIQKWDPTVLIQSRREICNNERVSPQRIRIRASPPDMV